MDPGPILAFISCHAQQLIQLRPDQVDILRDASDKVVKYEATIDSYKKKMEELSSLKRQLKLLEDNNTSLLQANLALENDVKKTGNWKPQVRWTLSKHLRSRPEQIRLDMDCGCCTMVNTKLRLRLLDYCAPYGVTVNMTVS